VKPEPRQRRRPSRRRWRGPLGAALKTCRNFSCESERRTGGKHRPFRNRALACPHAPLAPLAEVGNGPRLVRRASSFLTLIISGKTAELPNEHRLTLLGFELSKCHGILITIPPSPYIIALSTAALCQSMYRHYWSIGMPHGNQKMAPTLRGSSESLPQQRLPHHGIISTKLAGRSKQVKNGTAPLMQMSACRSLRPPCGAHVPPMCPGQRPGSLRRRPDR
jgi:hypothetical protein